MRTPARRCSASIPHAYDEHVARLRPLHPDRSREGGTGAIGTRDARNFSYCGLCVLAVPHGVGRPVGYAFARLHTHHGLQPAAEPAIQVLLPHPIRIVRRPRPSFAPSSNPVGAVLSFSTPRFTHLEVMPGFDGR